ncbi:MAG: FAD-dependent oxidoreductase [Planktomarina sp.]|nr:FAD-dependent oxidoreductase [Planktomarina sp.]
MAREKRHDILFEPIQIGPKTLRNRFWQVPHCNGAGSDRPGFQAKHRGTKAEGGFAAIFTEVCMVSQDSDAMPFVASKLIDKGDIRNLRMMTDEVHKHGGLAGVELTHGSSFCFNSESRMPGRGPSQVPNEFNPMSSAREISISEIKKMQRDHVDAALRAREAGFDLLTVFCGLATIPNYFLYKWNNKRTDEYGGSFENRARFTVELLQMMREEIDDCAIGIRFPIDTLDEPFGYGDLGVRAQGEGMQFIELLDDLVDYWDINIGTLNWGEDAGSSRFFETNHQEQYTKYAKQVSKKPVINVGRFTDPDTMVNAINSGQCDIIGMARPSIADPFLPKKIEEGRYEDIRECIGCNVCVSRWEQGGPPIWCTQNTTAGEEYRRGWHPEKFTKTTKAEPPVIVLGAGPAGLECAMTLGKRGYETVQLIDAGNVVGGHMNWLTKITGFGDWKRVVDWRKTQIDIHTNVGIELNTKLSYENLLEYGAEHIVFATGSHWDTTGMSAILHDHIGGADASLPSIVTPEQYMVEGKKVGKRVVVIDNEGYYMGSAMAIELAQKCHEVTYINYSETVGPYLRLTLEEQRVYMQLMELGVKIVSSHMVVAAVEGKVTAMHLYSGEETEYDYDTVMLVTHRISDCELYDQMLANPGEMEEAGIKSIHLIGDAHTPGMIAQATFSGARLAREFDTEDPDFHQPFIRERRLVGSNEDDYTIGADAQSNSLAF